MKTIEKSMLASLKGLLFASCLLIMSAGMTGAQTRQLPIDYYLDLLPTVVQGWQDPASGNTLFIDAYGKANTFRNLGLPTTIDGNVRIQTLRDGTERVTVEAHSRNAICYGFNGMGLPAFGFSPLSVANNLGPASLGQSNWKIVFAPQPAGQFDVNGPTDTLMASVSCTGELRAGSGYAELAPGFAQTRQTGLLSTGVPTGCPREGDEDCFPAEKVQFKPRGN
jgi:hypothetical protein